MSRFQPVAETQGNPASERTKRQTPGFALGKRHILMENHRRDSRVLLSCVSFFLARFNVKLRVGLCSCRFFVTRQPGHEHPRPPTNPVMSYSCCLDGLNIFLALGYCPCVYSLFVLSMLIFFIVSIFLWYTKYIYLSGILGVRFNVLDEQMCSERCGLLCAQSRLPWTRHAVFTVLGLAKEVWFVATTRGKVLKHTAPLP